MAAFPLARGSSLDGPAARGSHPTGHDNVGLGRGLEGRVELGALQRRVSEVKNEHVLVEPGMRCAACEMMLGTERVALTKERKVVHARCVSKEELIELTDLFCRVCSYHSSTATEAQWLPYGSGLALRSFVSFL